jgi:hypothetical protein
MSRVVMERGWGAIFPQEKAMGRREGYPLYLKKYCGDTLKDQVHDLDREDKGLQGCRIDEIIASGRARPFIPDALEQAHNDGFADCPKCIGETRRRSLRSDYDGAGGPPSSRGGS